MANRWCSLALKAHTSGSLDFSKAKNRDFKWNLKELFVLDSLEKDIGVEINKLNHDWHCAAAQVTGWDEDEELYEEHRKHALRTYNLIGKARLPWYKWITDEGKTIAQLWKALQDQKKDPKVVAAIDKERHRLENISKEAIAQEKRLQELDSILKQASKKKERLNKEKARRIKNAQLSAKNTTV